ncbi:MAG TPA: NmrA family NAD(P)-binding protein [Gaiellaceae bacterium]
MRTVAVTGASGHVGSRLVEALADVAVDVRPLTREAGDVGDRAAMRSALAHADAVYYLVHSLDTAGDFEERERRSASEFGAAAHECGVQRLIYLGGIVHDDDASPHLRSRREVGEILRASGVPTIELRASIVIGSGSASFDLVRTLVERLPTAVVPDWLSHAAQPIALDDVVAYLVAALDVPVKGDAVYEVGGADRVTYRDLLDEVAAQLDRPAVRLTAPLPAPPVGLPELPDTIAALVPKRARLTAHLLESLQHDSDVRDDRALRDFQVRPRGLRAAVAQALAAS